MFHIEHGGWKRGERKVALALCWWFRLILRRSGDTTMLSRWILFSEQGQILIGALLG